MCGWHCYILFARTRASKHATQQRAYSMYGKQVAFPDSVYPSHPCVQLLGDICERLVLSREMQGRSWLSFGEVVCAHKSCGC